MSAEWKQEGEVWRCGDVAGERSADDNALVITSFGVESSLDEAMTAIRAAMPLGKIRLRVTAETTPMIDQLKSSGLIKWAPTVGTQLEELGVIGIKRA